MTTRTASLVVDLATIPGVSYVGARTVAAPSPSSLNPVEDEMWVYINGALTIREYDPDLEQP